MTDDLNPTGMERYDRWQAAVRGRTLFADEAGDAAYRRPSDLEGLKVQVIRKHQGNFEIRNVRIEPGQTFDLKVGGDGGLVLDGYQTPREWNADDSFRIENIVPLKQRS